MSMIGMHGGKTVYDRLIRCLFSGNMAPGSKVVEQDLADALGVSRIPIRESLGKMVGQGLLVGEKGGRGVRMRKYTVEDIRQLYEARGVIEGGAARAASRSATDTDIARLQIICRQTKTEIGNYGSKRWAELDHAYHAALADASHNERLAQLLKLMLTECHFIFYLYPSRSRKPTLSPEDATVHMQEVLEGEHRALLNLIIAGDADAAARKAREDMHKSGLILTQTHVTRNLRE